MVKNTTRRSLVKQTAAGLGLLLGGVGSATANSKSTGSISDQEHHRANGILSSPKWKKVSNSKYRRSITVPRYAEHEVELLSQLPGVETKQHGRSLEEVKTPRGKKVKPHINYTVEVNLEQFPKQSAAKKKKLEKLKAKSEETIAAKRNQLLQNQGRKIPVETQEVQSDD